VAFCEVGATRNEIASQFLVEAALLTLAGGLLGAILGTVGSFLTQHLADWPTALSPLILFLALGVGIGFGFYPAWSAARYLGCGDWNAGFARVRCGSCAEEFLVALDCWS
jgi:predicted lysophospholipase L1 biosynthesis ABC-type transport system permease subunit